jgi:DNA-binding IclR family transcriptional regulator
VNERTPASAPGVTRTIAVLEFLAARRGEAFTLAELVRRLAVNKSTLHTILAILEEAGYVARHPIDKSYTLGPALVALGEAAAASPAVDIAHHARDEMRALADEFGVQCMAGKVVGSSILLVAHAGVREPLGQHLAVGQRLPFVPPLGTVFVAWSPPDVIDAWLRRLGPRATNDQLARYRRAIAAVRTRGFSIALEADARRELGRAVAARDASVDHLVEELGHQEYMLMELERSATYRLSLVAAPVFGPDGAVAMAIGLVGFPDPLDARSLLRAGERVRAAAAAITRAIHGRAPDDALED